MNTNLNTATEALMEKRFGKEAEVKENETREEYANRMEDMAHTVFTTFNTALVRIKEISGMEDVVNAAYCMMAEWEYKKFYTEDPESDMVIMANAFNNMIQEEIDFLNELGSEKALKKAIALRAYTEDAKGVNIFESFIGGLIWISRKISAKMQEWYGRKEHGIVVSGIIAMMKKLGSLLKQGAKFVLNKAGMVTGYIVGGAIMAASAIKGFITKAFNKIKEWKETCKQKAAVRIGAIQEQVEKDIEELNQELAELELEEAEWDAFSNMIQEEIDKMEVSYENWTIDVGCHCGDLTEEEELELIRKERKEARIAELEAELAQLR